MNQAYSGAPAVNPFSSPALAVQLMPPRFVVRMVSLAICAMVAIAMAFAYFAKMDIVVTVQGKVIPSGKSKVVQPLEPGIVRALLVRDGQHVRAGEVLVELDPTTTGADRERLQREDWEAQAEVQRTNAQVNGATHIYPPADMPRDIAANQTAMLTARLSEQAAKLAGIDADLEKRRADADAIESNLAQLRTSLPVIRQKHQMREEWAKTGHLAQSSVMETQLELMNAEKEIAIQANRLKESRAGYQVAVQQRLQAIAEFKARSSAEHAEAVKRQNASKQELVKANQRWRQQMLRAPIDGVVQQLAVTTVGGVVTAAQPLLTIVPEQAPLEIEAQVLNRDIGHLKVGQQVINKVETFDFTRYGYLSGELLWVGTDAVQDQKLGPVYPVRIRLDETRTPKAVNGRYGEIAAGMNITSDIRTDERRLIEYVLAPMLRYQQEAMRER